MGAEWFRGPGVRGAGYAVFGRGEVDRDCGCDVLWVCGEWPGGGTAEGRTVICVCVMCKVRELRDG